MREVDTGVAPIFDDGKVVGVLSLGDVATEFGNKKVGQVLERISADPVA